MDGLYRGMASNSIHRCNEPRYCYACYSCAFDQSHSLLSISSATVTLFSLQRWVLLSLVRWLITFLYMKFLSFFHPFYISFYISTWSSTVHSLRYFSAPFTGFLWAIQRETGRASRNWLLPTPVLFTSPMNTFFRVFFVIPLRANLLITVGYVPRSILYSLSKISRWVLLRFNQDGR